MTLKDMIIQFAKGRLPPCKSFEALEAMAGYTKGDVTAAISRLVQAGRL